MTQMRSRPDCDTPVHTLSQSLDGTDERGWEGGQGTGCEWLAGLVSRVCLYVDCTDGRSGAGCE